MVEDMQAEVDQQRVEDEAWYQKQELLRKAEETRREMLLQEEEKMVQQRQRCVDHFEKLWTCESVG